MAINTKNLLISLVVKAFNVTNETAAEIIDDADENLNDSDVLPKLLQLDKDRVKALKTKAYDDGHKKAKGETLAEFEDAIREEYNITDTSLKGADLIKSVVQTKHTQDGGEKPLSEDAIKKHPLFIALQDEKKAAVKKVTDDFTLKLTEAETGYKRKDTLAYAQAEALKLFESLNPILPENANVATNQKRLFVKALLDGNTFEKQGDRMVILDGEGKVKEDGHGNAITFDDYVKNTANDYFTFKKTDVGGNSGSKQDGSGGSSSGGTMKFKNEDDYMTFATDTTKPLADRQAAATAWEAQQAGTAEV